MASKLIYIRSCYIFHSNNAFRDLRIIDPSNMLELLQVSVTCMEPVGPERRDTNLHSRELLSLIRFVQPVVSYPESELFINDIIPIFK
jgi:hypothetical protein